jgi:hypothetical protein
MRVDVKELGQTPNEKYEKKVRQERDGKNHQNLKQ